MCFSPQADFTAGAVLTVVGVETLRHVRVRRELIVGALPLLFGLHQLVEGFVWLGLRGQAKSRILRALTTLLEPQSDAPPTHAPPRSRAAWAKW